MKQIPCVCGRVVKGEDDDELWRNAQEHLRQDHPELVGKVSREDLLAQAEEVPKPRSRREAQSDRPVVSDGHAGEAHVS